MEKERELENRSERTRAVHNKVTQINHQLGKQASITLSPTLLLSHLESKRINMTFQDNCNLNTTHIIDRRVCLPLFVCLLKCKLHSAATGAAAAALKWQLPFDSLV